MRKALVLLVLLAAGGTGLWYRYGGGEAEVAFRTTTVARDDLLVTISATGTVEPEELVDVGAQVAGRILEFGKDPSGSGRPVDYGSVVEQGTVLALIDTSVYESDVQQATAQVEQTEANVQRAQADLGQMKAKLRQAEQNWKRAKELGPSRALSATDYDSYEAAYQTALATVAVGDATVVQAQKSVQQAKAALDRAKTNLSYCTIKSPVKGVIVDRRVNIGQTVVASLNAPSLFLIAKDLRKMQVWVAVNETDIGSIYPGQPVTFTVDAFPDEVFYGTVGKIRLNASMTQNVVTYTVEVNTDNKDGKLLPYLTANVDFEVAHCKDVLLVQNGALRYTPPQHLIAPEARGRILGGGSGPSATTHAAASSRAETRPAQKTGTLWVQEGRFLRPVDVRLGLTDMILTVIDDDAVEEGDVVVVGEMEEGQLSGAASPFAPQIVGRRRGI